MKCKEIWMVDLMPTEGAEISKKRPCIIVNDESIGILPLRVIIPITEWKPRFASAEWMVKLNPDAKNLLSKTSAADCFQVRNVSNARFQKQVGIVSDTDFEEIKTALKIVFNLT